MRKKAILLLLQACSFIYCLSQTPADLDFRVPDFIPPSPDAAALVKTGLVGTSLSTGAVNVNIPLYTFSGNKYSLPLSLSYATTGVRVNDIASIAGMGWNLEFGGVVTRTVLGLPDEMREGVSLNNFTSPSLTTIDQNLYDYLQSTQADRESDIFNFNVLGISGSFYLDSLLNPVSLSKNNIRITRLSGANFIDGFEITDDKGILYRLTEIETTMKRGAPGNKCKSLFGYDDLSPQATAWYLSCVKVNSYDSILFNYSSGTGVYQGEVTQTLAKCISTNLVNCNGSTSAAFGLNTEDLTTCISTVTNELKVINEIVFYDGSRAVFGYDDQRLEIGGGARLRTVKIFNPGNKLIKYYRLTYTLYTSNSSLGVPGSITLTDAVKYRNFLDTLEDVNTTDTNVVLSYIFQYNSPESLPKRLSFAQDHWGYYNGAGNGYFIPALPNNSLSDFFDGEDGNPVKNGNREPSAGNMLYGTLKKVIYPAGGYDTLQYESPYVKKYNTVKAYSLSRTEVTNGETWDELAEDTIYIPFDQEVEIDCGCSRNVTPPDFHGSCTFNIVPHDTGIYTFFYNNITVNDISSHDVLFLKAGYYTVSASGTWDTTRSVIDVRYQQNPPVQVPYNDLLGGIVIGRIKSFTDATNLALEKVYKYSIYPDSTVYNIKSIVNENDYYTLSEERNFQSCPGDGQEVYACIGLGRGEFVTLNSSIVNSTSVIGASPYYFKNVVEYTIDRSNKKNGYTHHRFKFADELGFGLPPQTIHGMKLPGVPFNYVGSFVVGEDRTTQYDSTGPGYRLIADKKTYYSLTKLKEVTNHQVRKKAEFFCDGTVSSYINAFDVNSYKLGYTFIRPDSIEDITYSPAGDSLKNMTRLYYENPDYAYANKTITQNSKGETIELSRQFPHDLQASNYNSAGVITKMIQKNLVSPAVIATRKVNSLETQKLVTTFREYPSGTNNLLVDSVQQYHQGSMSNYYFNSSYDSKLNPAGIISQQEPPVAIIWDYQGMYPVAKVAKAEPGNTAYSSFETGNTGNIYLDQPLNIVSGDGVTGNKCYAINGVLARFGLNTAQTYVVSLWTKNGVPNYNGFNGATQVIADNNNWVAGKTIDGWTYREKELTGVTTINVGGGGGLVDEVRIYPKGAQMITYTYDPLIGVTSQCDPNNRIAYYEYDGFGRLKTIRDENKNVLKTFDYQYQQALNQ